MHKASRQPWQSNVSISIILALVLGFLAVAYAPPKALASDDTPDKLSFLGTFEDVTAGTITTFTNVRPGVDATIEVVSLTNVDGNKLNRLDRPDSSEPAGWLDTQYNTTASGFGVASFKIKFFNGNGPVTFSLIRVNAYDIDFEQYVEFDNVESFELTSDTIITTTTVGRTIKFQASNVSASTSASSLSSGAVHSHGEARARVTFVNVSELTYDTGIKANANGSFQFDFGLGLVWTNRNREVISGFLPLPSSSSSGAAQTFVPQKQHVNTLNQNPAPGETVAMFGAYFGGVTEAFVGGVKVDIVSKSDNRVDIRMPRGLTGALDVELKSPLGTLLLPKHFTIGKLQAAGTRKATIIVGGFDHNSRKMTARMKARIDRWLDRNSDLSTLTCTGFTSLPRRTTDVELSTNRGITACDYAKTQRPEVTTSVSQGVEDPRPGSNVRRVRLVLTP